MLLRLPCPARHTPARLQGAMKRHLGLARPRIADLEEVSGYVEFFVLRATSRRRRPGQRPPGPNPIVGRLVGLQHHQAPHDGLNPREITFGQPTAKPPATTRAASAPPEQVIKSSL